MSSKKQRVVSEKTNPDGVPLAPGLVLSYVVDYLKRTNNKDALKALKKSNDIVSVTYVSSLKIVRCISRVYGGPRPIVHFTHVIP